MFVMRQRRCITNITQVTNNIRNIRNASASAHYEYYARITNNIRNAPASTHYEPPSPLLTPLPAVPRHTTKRETRQSVRVMRVRLSPYARLSVVLRASILVIYQIARNVWAAENDVVVCSYHHHFRRLPDSLPWAHHAMSASRSPIMAQTHQTEGSAWTRWLQNDRPKSR